MEAEWVADRSYLRQLRHEHAQWTDTQLAEGIGRSLSWVKKGKKRLAATSAEDERVLFSQSRARQHPPAKVSQPVVEAILAIREQPPEELQRTPGPLTILYYLPRQETLAGQRLPTLTSISALGGRPRSSTSPSSACARMKNGKWTSRM